MAEFEELRLTVNLVDNASAGLQRLRGEIGQLTQSATQMTTAANQAVAGITNLGSASTRAAPGVRTLQTEMRTLARSSEETGRGLATMATSAMQGARAYPMLALGLREAATGVSGLSESLGAIAPAARVAALAVGGLAVGVVALGAAVAIYGVQVFKFAKEMDQLAKTARTIGMSFGELKNAQDQARMFGQAAESVTRNFQGIQNAQLDLYKNNSQLRQKLLAQGVNADWISQLATSDPTKAHNMIVQYGQALEKQALAAGVGANVARAIRNQFQAEFGVSADAELLKPIDPATARKLEEIARTSGQIAKVWGEIDAKMRQLTLQSLADGLPYVLSTLQTVNSVFDSIAAVIGKINEGLALIGTSLGGVFKAQLRAVVDMIPGLKPLLLGIEMLGKLKGLAVGSAAAAEGNPTARPSDDFIDRWDALKQKSSFQGANDNNPLLQRVSFSSDDLVDETGRNTTETAKLTGQIEKLNLFYDRLQNGQVGGRGGGGGGGFQNAAFTTGGGVEGFGGGTSTSGGGAASFGSAEYPNLGGGNPAVGGQVPQSLGGGGAPSGSQTGGPAGSSTPGTAGSPAVPSDVLEKAKSVALHSGPGGVESFMREQGYPRAGAWCGQFAASVVKSVGGTPPQNPAIASNWRNYGTEVDSPQAGDIAVRRGARTGATGSHVTVVDTVDPKTGRFSGIGGNQGGRAGASSFKTGTYQFFRGGRVDDVGTAAAPAAPGASGASGGSEANSNTYLAQQRERLKKELDDNPELKKRFAALVDLENPGAGTAVAESAMNRAAMSGRTMESILQGGPKSFYGPARKGLVGPRMAALARDPKALADRMRQIDEAAAGSNLTKGATDQGSAGDPNYEAGGTGVNINRERFNDWGGFKGVGYSRRWREAQQAEVNRAALDRTALSNKTEVNASGKLSVDVNAPPSTKVEASGSGLFKNTELQRSTAMPYTGSGPSASETANQYMASR